jgi:uncharacterized membrane protein
MNPIVIILFRWLHVFTACVAVGGVFFMRIVVPVGLWSLEPEARLAAQLRFRKVFKIIIHTSILLLLLSGTVNSMLNWSAYAANPAMTHPFWGGHVLLALVVFSIAIWILIGPEPPANHLTLMGVNVALLVVIVALASITKYGREHQPRPAVPPPATTQPIAG